MLIIAIISLCILLFVIFVYLYMTRVKTTTDNSADQSTKLKPDTFRKILTNISKRENYDQDEWMMTLLNQYNLVYRNIGIGLCGTEWKDVFVKKNGVMGQRGAHKVIPDIILTKLGSRYIHDEFLILLLIIQNSGIDDSIKMDLMTSLLLLMLLLESKQDDVQIERDSSGKVISIITTPYITGVLTRVSPSMSTIPKNIPVDDFIKLLMNYINSNLIFKDKETFDLANKDLTEIEKKSKWLEYLESLLIFKDPSTRELICRYNADIDSRCIVSVVNQEYTTCIARCEPGMLRAEGTYDVVFSTVLEQGKGVCDNKITRGCSINCNENASEEETRK